MNIVTRSVSFRAADKDESGDGHTLSGYAAVFNQDTTINSWEGRFTERIAPGAFRKTLRENKPILQFNHGRDVRTGAVPIGVFTELAEDDHGLAVEARLFENQLVEPIRQAIEGGAVTGMSFSFQVVRDEWRDQNGKVLRGEALRKVLWDGADGLSRTIKEVKLFEAGPVVTPAYSGTSVGVRSADELSDAERQSIADEYARSMVVADEPLVDSEAIREWLRMETEWRADVAVWLREEAEYHAIVRWLEAETNHRANDAAESGTSENPDNPDRDAVKDTDTLRREPEKKVTEQKKAPKIVRTRAVTLNELKEALAIAEARTEELQDEFRDAEMPEAEEREYDQAKKDVDTYRARIEKVEKRLKEMTSHTPAERGTPGFIASTDAADLHDLDAIRGSATSLADAKVKMRDAAQRIAERSKFAVSQRSEAKDHAIHLLDQDHTGDLAARFISMGSDTYERAWSKYAAGHTIGGLSFEEQRALQLGSDADGGFAVPVQLDPTVIHTSAGVVNPVRQLATTKTITGKEYQGVTSAGTTVSRSLEGAEFAENSWTLAQPTIRTERVTGYTTFTFEAEAWNAIREEIVFALRDAKDREEAESFTNGNGTSPNASGIVSTHIAPNLVTATGTAAFAAGDLYKLKEALDPRYRANAVWMLDEAILHLIRQWATNDGPNLIQHIDGPNPDRLLGFPIHENFNMTGVLTTGSKIVQFGDLSNYYIVDRVGMSIEVNSMVLGSNRRPTGQRGIAAYWMNNAKWWVPAGAKTLVTG
ncbi:phage major capsid protein [Nocardia sp. NPDC057440]|uniref:phage major capsid protein n=1 Tax=Nocardia sp. NPDC057440 TaxID=3346134 RepID=UPI00366C0A82